MKALRTSTTTAATMYTLYRTIETEIEEPLKGTVKGSIPHWVNGSLYRNGPGMFEIGEHKFKHRFDGMALLQRYHIANGTVTYQRKYLRSDAYKANMAAKRITTAEFGTTAVPDPCKNIFSRFLTVFEHTEKTDNTSVNVFPLKTELYASTETNFINRVDPNTLDKLEKVNLEEKVKLNLATAHPHYESDGSMYNLGQSFQRGLFTALVAVPPKREAEKTFPAGEIVCKIQSSWKLHYNYYHSFSMTENYFVLVEQPLLACVPKLVFAKIFRYTFADSLAFYPEIKCRFRVINRKTGQEVNPDITMEADSFVYFHQINAYEDQGYVIVDISCHQDSKIIDAMYMKNLTSKECEEILKKVANPQARRYVIPLHPQTKESTAEYIVPLENTSARCKKVNQNTYHCEPEVLADINLEFPQINYAKYNTKKYRYIYGVSVSPDEAVSIHVS